MRRAARQYLAVRPDRAAHAGRADRDRHRDLLAEHRRFELAVRDVEHHALAETDGVEVAAVLAQRDLREGAGLHIVHEGLGNAIMRALAQVLDAGDAYRAPSSQLASLRHSDMRSPMRQASAWMVSEGLTPPLVGKSEPSHTQRLGIDQLRPSLSTTLSLRVIAHPASAHQVRGVVVDPQLLCTRALEHRAHRTDRMFHQPSVVLGIGEGHARELEGRTGPSRPRPRRGCAAAARSRRRCARPAIWL